MKVFRNSVILFILTTVTLIAITIDTSNRGVAISNSSLFISSTSTLEIFSTSTASESKKYIPINGNAEKVPVVITCSKAYLLNVHFSSNEEYLSSISVKNCTSTKSPIAPFFLPLFFTLNVIPPTLYGTNILISDDKLSILSLSSKEVISSKTIFSDVFSLLHITSTSNEVSLVTTDFENFFKITYTPSLTTPHISSTTKEIDKVEEKLIQLASRETIYFRAEDIDFETGTIVGEVFLKDVLTPFIFFLNKEKLLFFPTYLEPSTDASNTFVRFLTPYHNLIATITFSIPSKSIKLKILKLVNQKLEPITVQEINIPKSNSTPTNIFTFSKKLFITLQDKLILWPFEKIEKNPSSINSTPIPSYSPQKSKCVVQEQNSIKPSRKFNLPLSTYNSNNQHNVVMIKPFIKAINLSTNPPTKITREVNLLFLSPNLATIDSLTAGALLLPNRDTIILGVGMSKIDEKIFAVLIKNSELVRIIKLSDLNIKSLPSFEKVYPKLLNNFHILLHNFQITKNGIFLFLSFKNSILKLEKHFSIFIK